MSGYRTLKVSDSVFLDLSRAIYLAKAANDREGMVYPPTQARHEALARVCKEWSSVALPAHPHDPIFDALCAADWVCSCGGTALNEGLVVLKGEVWCGKCLVSAGTRPLAAP